MLWVRVFVLGPLVALWFTMGMLFLLGIDKLSDERSSFEAGIIMAVMFGLLTPLVIASVFQMCARQRPITDLAELCTLLALPESVLQDGKRATDEFPLSVPYSFLRRMECGNPNDPLLLQVLPQNIELRSVAGFTVDPVGEGNGSVNRILRKYPGRALVLASSDCGVHCRFCFRRHFQKQKGGLSLDHIREATDVHEVILSGGDPLCLSNRELMELLHGLSLIPHVRRIRIHSRLPIVEPSRIDAELVDIFETFCPIYLVLHVNHPNELDDEVLEHIETLIDIGVPILSQTVLLKGVNDNLNTLQRLFETLVDHRILPYYLHQLDRVAGAAHFEVPTEVGLQLVTELRHRLPGYAVPQYVQEIVGETCKIPLFPLPSDGRQPATKFSN